MAFIDDVVSSAQKAGKFICEKAEDAKDYVSLEYKAITLKNKINEKYKELGRLVYELSENDAAEDGKTQELTDIIKGMLAEHSVLMEQMAKFKNICPKCAATNASGANFCAKCGTGLEVK